MDHSKFSDVTKNLTIDDYLDGMSYRMVGKKYGQISYIKNIGFEHMGCSDLTELFTWRRDNMIYVKTTNNNNIWQDNQVPVGKNFD